MLYSTIAYFLLRLYISLVQKQIAYESALSVVEDRIICQVVKDYLIQDEGNLLTVRASLEILFMT